MQEQFDHTFAICAYESSPYLEACICSLKRQTIQSEILIATSTPNEHIRGLAEKYDIPIFVNVGERGITQDWNFAYAQTITKYVTIAHQDDIYDREYSETALQFLRRSSHPLIFFSDYYEIRNEERIDSNRLLNIKRLMLLPLRIASFQKSKWVRRRILSFGSPICCPSVLYVRASWPRVLFQNHYRACEDWEAWEMISKQNGEFLYSTKRLVGHRIHESSETTATIVNNERSREEYEVLCKFWPKWFAKGLAKVYSKGQQSNQL